MSKTARFSTLITLVISTVFIPISIGTLYYNKKPPETYWDEPLIRKQSSSVPFVMPSGIVKDGGYIVAVNTYIFFYNRYRRAQLSHKKAKAEAIIQVKLRGGNHILISERMQEAIQKTYEDGLIVCK